VKCADVRAARFFGAAGRSARFPCMRWLVVVCLAALPALAGQHKIAVAPIEGVLTRADAAAVEEAVRAEVRGLDLALVPGAPADAAAAAELGATHLIVG